MAVEPLHDSDAAAFDRAQALLDWYDAHARALPWRAAPGGGAHPDPYAVWLSEVMLQQTTVAAVRPRFERFLARWPTLADLAAADEADVLSEWAGLGYYARARNLIACARAVVAEHCGAFPQDYASLRALPGLGDDTAAAIAAIAFDAPGAIPLDANLARVGARLDVIAEPMPGAMRVTREGYARWWPAARGGDVAQALMDVGSQICTVRGPRCLLCPLRPGCRAAALGVAEQLPVKPAKRPRRVLTGWAAVALRDDALWLVTRPEKGLLGGMRALPGSGWEATMPALPAEARPLGVVTHLFTHIALDLHIVGVDAPPPGEGVWWPLAELDAAGLPTLYRRAVALALRHGDSPDA